MTQASARRWLARAKGRLARARVPKPPEAFWEDDCFDLQQAVELSLKAIMIARGVRPPRTHDLAEVLRVLRTLGVPAPPREADLPELSRYAVAMRYPSEGDPATEADFRSALVLAIDVVSWARTQVPVGSE